MIPKIDLKIFAQLEKDLKALPAKIKAEIQKDPKAVVGGDAAKSALRMALGMSTVKSIDQLVTGALDS